jgi:hypothetical protein
MLTFGIRIIDPWSRFHSTTPVVRADDSVHRTTYGGCGAARGGAPSVTLRQS